MAIRVQCEGSDEIGAFARLTNGYCLVGLNAQENFVAVFESELEDVIPVIRCSVAGIKSVGVTTVGNKHGLILPHNTTTDEMTHIVNSVPDSVKVQRVDERLSALGNIIVCNEYVALVHPDVSQETVEIISDTLKVEVYRILIGDQHLCGSYTVLTNRGCLVHPGTTVQQMQELSALLKVPVSAGTVNMGQASVGGGLVANDWAAFCGSKTTSTELTIIDSIFKLSAEGDKLPNQGFRDALVESLL